MLDNKNIFLKEIKESQVPVIGVNNGGFSSENEEKQKWMKNYVPA